jgi:hypothetical protein
MERGKGVEPFSSAWKAEATIRYTNPAVSGLSLAKSFEVLKVLAQRLHSPPMKRRQIYKPAPEIRPSAIDKGTQLADVNIPPHPKFVIRVCVLKSGARMEGIELFSPCPPASTW